MAKKLPLVPLNDFILVEVKTGKHTTKGGVELTEANPDDNDSIQKGVCVAVGLTAYRAGNGWVLPEQEAQKEREQLIGKTVLWVKYADKDGTFTEYEGGKYVLIKIAQVMAYEQ